MKVEFARLGQGVPCDALQFVQGYKVVLNEKNDVVEVGIEAAIQFAERDAVWIGNVDFQIPKLTDANVSFRVALWQRDKTLDWDWLNVDFQFPGNLHDGSMQFVRMHIVADKVNIYCQARTSQQRQCASTDQNQAGGRRDSFSQGL